MKKELIAAEISPDETERREIRVEGTGGKVSMNSTSYVAAVRRQNPSTSRANTPIDDLWKTDLWMSNNIL